MAAALAASTVVPEIPRIPAAAEIVHVEVLVTDKRGRAVTGLGAGDFTLKQDGRPVEVVAFAAPPGGAATAEGPADTPSITAAAGAGTEPRTLVVYVDNRSLSPASRGRLLDGLEPFLRDELARRGARALVFAEDRGTRALTRLTGDPDEVAAALALARRGPAGQPGDAMAEQSTMELAREGIEAAERAQIPCTQALRQVLPIVETHAATRGEQAEGTLARLSAIVEAVSVIPGPKALLYLSEGLEQRPALHLYDWLADVCPAIREADAFLLVTPAAEHDLSSALAALAAKANAARVTLYPLDGAPLRPPGAAQVGQMDRRWIPSAGTSQVAETNLRAGEHILARETGGRTVLDASRIADLASDLEQRYSLGFAPGHPADGRTHHLRVEVRRKGVQVRHRLTYVHVERPEPGITRTLAALATGLASDALGATAVLEPSGRLRITVPLARLAADPGSGGRRGRVRVVLALRRSAPAAGTPPTETRERLVDVDLPSPADPGATRDLVIDVGAGVLGAAVGVEDAFSGRATYARVGS